MQRAGVRNVGVEALTEVQETGLSGEMPGSWVGGMGGMGGARECRW